MLTTRFDPLQELDRLTRQLARSAPPAPRPARRPAALPLDAYRQADRITVHVDVPGIDPDSIEVTVEKNLLTVEARRDRRGDEDVEWLVAERQHGTFRRELRLGEGLDADRVEASYDNGVLTVTVPVAEQDRARKVQIATGRPAPEDATPRAS